jgi:trehalose-6-phosphate synthase
LQKKNLNLPPDNIHLVCGNSLEPSTYERISDETGVNFSDIDLFYTYITLHDLFAEKIARDAKSGALYLVYGFHKILPQYKGLKVVIADIGSKRIAALYGQKRHY